MFIDSHAHLTFDDFSSDLPAVLERARNAGIDAIINPGNDLENSRRAALLAAQYDMIFHAVGIHPHHAKDVDQQQLDEIARLARETSPVAIGEIGLDYYYDFSPKEKQLNLFRTQVQLALELDKPLIIHCRDAYDDCLDLLHSMAPGARWRGVMHCFTGGLKDAQAFIELGFNISFAGMITFPNAANLRETAAGISSDHLLLETDAPYLAPVPLRGKRNEPANLLHIAKVLADIYKLEAEDIGRITSLNTRKLFSINNEPANASIVYKIRKSLYVNLTNRCTNRCVFCSREDEPSVKGHWLGLMNEPTAQEVIAAIGDPTNYDEIVFCGFGEPTMRLDVLKEVSAFVKQNGGKIRVNTNGQADIIHGREVAPELVGLVDVVSVSLNSAARDQYVDICRPDDGAAAYDAMIKFIESAKQHLPKVVVTALDYPGVDVEACERLAAKLGVEYRQRKYNEVG